MVWRQVGRVWQILHARQRQSGHLLLRGHAAATIAAAITAASATIRDHLNQQPDHHNAPEGEYALYVKRGWETMACVTPMEQFLRDRELLHEVEPGAFAL